MNLSTSDTSTKIYLAPLQGFTDYSFRAAFSGTFGTFDAAFSPFIETHKPEQRMYRDVLPEKNAGYQLIPQVLGNNAKEMQPVLAELQRMDYQGVNWNLGCPYSMVTKKMMGAGLLPHPDRIDETLNELFRNNTCRISVKMRLGLTNADDWKALIPILNRYPLSEVIIHARTATQMYKGMPNQEIFVQMATQLTAPVCYNGNIFTLEQFQKLSEQMPFVNRWMLGRGVLANPLLLQEIKTNQKASDEEVTKALEKLHDQLLYHNSTRLSGNSHLLNKVRPYWEYFAESLIGKEKGLKKIKKTVTLEAYKLACAEVFK